MTELLQAAARDLRSYTDAQAALDRICEIYERGADALRQRFEGFLQNGEAAGEDPCYPYVGIVIGPQEVMRGGEMSYGKLQGAGAFGATVTRPEMFRATTANSSSCC